MYSYNVVDRKSKRENRLTVALALVLLLSIGVNVLLAFENASIVDTYEQAITELKAPIYISAKLDETAQILMEETPVEEPVVEQTRYFNVPLDTALQDHIFKLCAERGIEPSYIMAMIQKESNYTASAVGGGGASLGLMQIQPRWHRDRMAKLGCTDLLDPYQNVTVGIDYLDELLDKGKPIEWALMAYNGGVGYANRNYTRGVVSTYASTIVSNSVTLENGRS